MPPTAMPNAFQLNAAQRSAVLSQAIEMYQPIATGTVSPASTSQINIVPRNVGLLKRFVIVCSATFNNTDGANAANITDLGASNLLSRVTFTDVQNNVRVDTAGWHLAQVAAFKSHRPLGSVLSLTNAGVKYGDNFGVVSAPATVAANGNGTVQFVYEVPVSYSDDDLRGAIFAGVINAQMNLSLYINTAPSVPAATDSTLAIYKGNNTSTLTNFTYTVYQVYLDQLPTGKNGVILPMTDISTSYELKKTAFSAMVAGNEYPIPYANYRNFLSTFVIYNHDSSADLGRVGGTDVNYWALQSANYTNIWKKSPVAASLEIRKQLGFDLPNGCYYFGTRRQPISTNTYGNMQLIVNPIAAAAQAYALVGWEDFALQNTLGVAGSLAG